MTRVLFVCLGNICRSPMAEGIFQKLVADRGLQDRFEIDSCGTSGWHAGEPPDPRTLAVLARNGVHLTSRARALVHADRTFDYILALDDGNLRDVQRKLGADAPVFPVLLHVGGGQVPDPYYGGNEGFEAVYAMLVPALEAWLQRMH